MRDILNSILSLIGSASLSDAEFSALTIVSAGVDLPTYKALLAVLDAREMVSDLRDRLGFYFRAKGLAIEAPPPGKSNIFIGSSLC